MADDLMGYLGIDTKAFVRSMKDAEKAVGFFAKAGIVASGLLGLRGLAREFANLGKEIDETRAKLIKGTAEYKQFQSASGGENSFSAPSNTLAAAGMELKNAWIAIRTAGLQALQGNIMAMEDAADYISDKLTGNKNASEKRSKERQEVAERARSAQSIIDQIDAISAKREKGVVTIREHQELMAAELQLLKEQARILSTGPKQDREKVHALKEREAALAIEIQQMNIAEELENNRALARTDSMKAEISGMQNIGKLIETIADYEEKILKARFEGKYVLEQQLKTQRDLSTEQLRVAEHNMTPRERMDARRSARKYARDLRAVTGHDVIRDGKSDGFTRGTDDDLTKRLAQMETQGGKPTPGSRLDRFKNARDAMNAGRERAGRAAAAADPAVRAVTLLESIDNKISAAMDHKLK